MRLHVIATFDRITKVFGVPMFVVHTQPALRDFHNEVRRKDPKNILSTNPHDFELWKINEYDDATGMFTDHDHELLGRGSDALDFPAI